jgi:hypothetical protein
MTEGKFVDLKYISSGSNKMNHSAEACHRNGKTKAQVSISNKENHSGLGLFHCPPDKLSAIHHRGITTPLHCPKTTDSDSFIPKQSVKVPERELQPPTLRDLRRE